MDQGEPQQRQEATSDCPPETPCEDRCVSCTARCRLARKLVIDERYVRRAMGVLAAILPVILVLFGTSIFEGLVMPSISHYYYHVMQHWYIITWVTIGFCLLAYRGYDTNEQVTGTIGGVAAIAAALLPPRELVPCLPDSGGAQLVWQTSRDTDSCNAVSRCEPVGSCNTVSSCSILDSCHPVSAGFHVFFTLVFFLMVFIFLWRFTRSDVPPEGRSREKVFRNRVYGTCMVGMVVGGAVCALTIVSRWQGASEVPWQPLRYGVLIGETIAIWSFALAWFVKGETILQDKLASRPGQPSATCCEKTPSGGSRKQRQP